MNKNKQIAFIIVLSILLLLFSAYPRMIWLIQIGIFFCLHFFLGLTYKRRLTFSFLSFAILLAISTYYSIDLIYSLGYFCGYLVILVLSSAMPQEKIPLVVKAFLTGTVCMGIISTVYSLLKITHIDINVFSPIETDTGLLVPYFGHAFYAVFILAVLPFVMENIVKKKRAWSFLFILLLFFLLMTFSKMAIFVGFLEIAVFLWAKKSSFQSLGIYSMACLLIGVVFFVSFFPTSFWLQEKTKKDSLGSRKEYFHQSLAILRSSPLPRIVLGYGFDSVYMLSHRFQTRPAAATSSSHNIFVQFFIENGFISLLLFLFILITTYRRNFPRYSLAEKITIPALFIHASVATSGVSLLPLMLFVFLLLMKNADDDADRKNRKSGATRTVPASLLLIPVFFFWAWYGIGFGKVVLAQNPDTASILFFPYEPAFWTYLANYYSTRQERIEDLSRRLDVIDPEEIDIRRSLIRNAYRNTAYCWTDHQASAFLLRIPYDLEMQEKFIDSTYRCQENTDTTHNDFFSQFHERVSETKEAGIFLRPVFLYAAVQYFKQNDATNYSFWMKKTWHFSAENANSRWYGDTYDHPALGFPFPGPFRVDVKMHGQGDLSGIGLVGKTETENESKFAKRKIFIGYKDDGNTLVINLDLFQSTPPIVLYEEKSSAPYQGLSLTFEENGRSVHVESEEGVGLADIVIREKTNGEITDGIFPGGIVYTSFGVSQYSELTIDALHISRK